MVSVRTTLGVCMLLLLASASRAQLGLNTGFAANSSQAGIMFDIEGTQRLQIRGFDLNLQPGTWDIEIYTTLSGGPWLGSEASPGDWGLVGNYLSVASVGANQLTELPHTLDIDVPAGSTQGVYITVASGFGTLYRSGNTNVGTAFAGNTAIRVETGIGKAYPFGQSFPVTLMGAGREFSGRVSYRVVKEAPFCEDFDGAPQGTLLPFPWEQIQGEADPIDGPDVDWIVDANGTPTAGTGPDADHTTVNGNGSYAYVEDSGNNHTCVAMRTPLIAVDAFAEPQLSFWYHSSKNVFGLALNALEIHVIDRAGFRVGTLIALKDDSSIWQQLIFDLSAFKPLGEVMIEFSVDNLQGGGSSFHDIAIDDVCISDGGFDRLGSGEGIELWTQVAADGGRLNPNKDAIPGQVLNIALTNTGTGLQGAVPVIVGQLYLDVSPPGLGSARNLRRSCGQLPRACLLRWLGSFGIGTEDSRWWSGSDESHGARPLADLVAAPAGLGPRPRRQQRHLRQQRRTLHQHQLNPSALGLDTKQGTNSHEYESQPCRAHRAALPQLGPLCSILAQHRRPEWSGPGRQHVRRRGTAGHHDSQPRPPHGPGLAARRSLGADCRRQFRWPRGSACPVVSGMGG